MAQHRIGDRTVGNATTRPCLTSVKKSERLQLIFIGCLGCLEGWYVRYVAMAMVMVMAMVVVVVVWMVVAVGWHVR